MLHRLAGFLCVWLAALSLTAQEAKEEGQRPISFVAVADAHTCTGNLRFMPDVVKRINALPIQPDFVMALGDNVSGGLADDVLHDAIDFETCCSHIKAPHFYVIGNHECIPVEIYKKLTWPQLLRAWKMKERWYSFDVRDVHVCVLDGWIALNSKAVADVFEQEQKWFLADLASTKKKTIVFIHQAIGFQQEDCPVWVRTNNRKFWPEGNFFEETLEANRDKILGVFEGHKHKSLWKRRNGVVYHQIGAGHDNGGQFAQVLIDPSSGEFYVQADPPAMEQDSGFTTQQSYGNPEVMERCRRAMAVTKP